ncbi:hypothetical protein Taro_046022 [Colocasia esculenta]|uniref:Uncharacterized protein n=1 Tax=Colocasia esculenta TaxID=4460 RepID=A0A843X3L0_COLES|nr:hypothetical protein [Colocasia esculenta]
MQVVQNNLFIKAPGYRQSRDSVETPQNSHQPLGSAKMENTRREDRPTPVPTRTGQVNNSVQQTPIAITPGYVPSVTRHQL